MYALSRQNVFSFTKSCNTFNYFLKYYVSILITFLHFLDIMIQYCHHYIVTSKWLIFEIKTSSAIFLILYLKFNLLQYRYQE